MDPLMRTETWVLTNAQMSVVVEVSAHTYPRSGQTIRHITKAPLAVHRFVHGELGTLEDWMRAHGPLRSEQVTL